MAVPVRRTRKSVRGILSEAVVGLKAQYWPYLPGIYVYNAAKVGSIIPFW
jgi:hypothetical protein